MKHYVGGRTPLGCEVDVIDKEAPGGGYPLNLRLDLREQALAASSGLETGTTRSRFR